MEINVPISQREAESQSEVITRRKSFTAYLGKRAKIENGEIIGGDVFVEERSKSLEEWNKNEDYNVGNPVGDYDIVANREIEGEIDRITI